MLKSYEVAGNYFEKATSRKEAAKFVKELKADRISLNGGTMFDDEGLYVEYTDGRYVCIGSGESVEKVRVSNIERMIYDADWGIVFYNAYPQKEVEDEENNLWTIRIAEEPGMYGEAVDLDALEAESTEEVEEEVAEEATKETAEESKEPCKGITKSYKVYGYPGHRQRESFCESYRLDFSESGDVRVIEVENSDKTGTNDYSVVRITRNTAQECEEELEGQLYDGIFENSRVGRVVDII